MAAGRIQVGSAIPLEDPGARVAAAAARHERTLLRVARQVSLCHDDALDAYQRALEIFVRRVGTVDPATELAWLKVVVRHEAIAIRRTRSESVTGEELDLDAFMPGPERTVEDQIASGERLARSAEALRALKPDEARALMMKAHGLTYEEIARRNGWTYTKVNRAITEGRRRFMRVYEGIESGEECARFAPIVEALAQGSATSAQVLEIRPHLRHCVACRATVRDLHLSRIRRASLFSPLFAVLEPLRQLFGGSARPDERIHDDAPTLEELLRTDSPDAPNRLPAQPDELIEASDQFGRLVSLKNELAALLHRASASDVATGVHIATASGGGRLTTMATVLALCLSSVGAGSVCVVVGLLPDPTRVVGEPREPVNPRADAARRPARKPIATSSPQVPIRLTSTNPTPTPTATPAPVRRRERRAPSASVDPSQGTAPDSHEHAPISPPVTATASSFNPQTPPPTSAPAAAPATGGSEFAP